jgi:hypothetical protein
LTEGGRTLDDGESDRLNVKLEEDARDTLVTNLSFIVCHAVLVRMQRFGTWCNVGRWNDSEEVVICNEVIMRNLEGVIKGLGDLWEMFAEGKLGDDM